MDRTTLNVSSRRNMKGITMVAIEREQFGDHGKIKSKGEDTTVHLTQD
jgi:hypothetical protein